MAKKLKYASKKMQIKYGAPIFFLWCILLVGCSKKHVPQTEATATEIPEAKKAAIRKVIKTPVPKIITVDDRGAKKAVDGRLYYDLEGHRYWKNYDDGKYYKFSSSMGGNPAFKPH